MADMNGPERLDGNGPSPSGSEARSSSPGIKRTAADVTEPDRDSAAEHRNANSAEMIASTNSGDPENNSDSVYPTPSSMAAYTAPTATRNTSTAESLADSDDRPSIDDQVARVTLSAAQPLQDKQKGYVISMSWLKRVLARSTIHADKIDKSAAEGEIGPVNNTDLVLDTDPSAVFKDEAGEPFVPLHPDLRMGEDFEIVTQEGWDMIMKWYGLADESPVIVRYAHKIAPADDDDGNVLYELNPPVFTVLKLANPAAPMSPQALKEKNARPVKTLASRYSNFQQWLRQVKELANINMSTKVRVWAIQGNVQSTSNTPAASRSASPAPMANAAKLASGLVLDLNAFLSIPEGQRLLLPEIKDQTNNPNYNGRMTVGLAGLAGTGEILVLEEQIGGRNGGGWISETSKQTLNRLGVPAGNSKAPALLKPKAKDPPQTRRPVPPTRPTRGKRSGGRTLGCTGLRNLGNTCYMNGALQCMRAVEELTHYFLTDSYKPDLNPSNPLAHHGNIAKEYAKLIHLLYDESKSSVTPSSLRDRVGGIVPAFGGFTQQDSQEFLLFLLDGLQEDLNRILKKPYIERPDSTDDMVYNKEELRKLASEHWRIYKARNDSVISDLFAGMYKSTIVCPVCNKVSITFDPFNNLTLQIPGPDVWSHVFYYFPIHVQPVQVDVEVPGISTFKAVKDSIARKMGTDPERLVIGDIYNSKIFKMFDDAELVKEAGVGADDKLGVFELESAPTDYTPGNPEGLDDRNVAPDFGSPKADRMLIPVFQRGWLPRSPYNRNKERRLFGPPNFVVITREEAFDFDSILRKLLVKVSTMTNRHFLNENDQEDVSYEESTTDGDDADSGDSKIKATSVEGEDGMVDVSVRKETNGSRTAGGHIPERFRNLFEVKTVPAGPAVPLGYSGFWEIRDFEPMSSRAAPKASGRQKEARTSAHSTDRKTSDESDEGSSVSASDSDSVVYPSRSRRSSLKSESAATPLITPGEGIILDWNEESYDALFGATPGSGDSFRGSLIWPKVEKVPDPKLHAIREERKERKKKGIPLDECLDEFSREEILSESNAWYCPKCKEHRRARKRFELWTAPDILIIHLKRFTAGRRYGGKLEDRINFPVTGLDMTGRVEAPEEGKSLIYDLFAVDDHHGGMGGGHYTACAKNFIDNQWYDYNDSLCNGPINPEKAVSASAYLLFYRRRSDRPLGGKALEQITESSMRHLMGSESDSDWESTAPGDEAQRLGSSSRNGSSNFLAGVGAGRRADGGQAAGSNEDGDEFSSGDDIYDSAPQQEGMNLDSSYYQTGTDPYHTFNNDPGLWSFDRVTDAHQQSWQETPAPPGSMSEGEQHGDLFEDDGASNRAVDGGESSDADVRLASLTDGAADSGPPATPMDTSASVQDIPPPLDADDSEDLDVVELKVNDDERMQMD